MNPEWPCFGRAEVAEQSIAQVCKTCARQGYLGANPSLGTMTSGKRLLAKVTPASRMLRGVSHPYRLAILYILSHEPAWPEFIARFVPIEENLLAHHLKAMVAAGWLRKYTEGRHRMYAVKANVFKHLWNFLPQH